MHIRKTESGKYEVFVDVTPRGAKKRKIKSKTFKKKSEAKKWATDIESERSNKEIPYYIKDQTVAEYFEDWMENYVRRQLGDTTYKGYKTIVERHIKPDLGHIKLNELNAVQIQDYEYRKLDSGRINGEGGLSPTTVLQHHHVLSKGLNSALKKRIIGKNPCKGVEAPRAERPEILYMTKDQVKRFLALSKEKGIWHYTYMYLAIDTGMRRGAMMGLKWRDVNFREGIITARRSYIRDKDNNRKFIDSLKRQRSRRITIDEKAQIILKNLKEYQEELKRSKEIDYEDNDLIFAKENGKPFSPDTATKRCKRLVRELGMGELKLHDLRHTYATLALEAGVPIKVVSERLGHASVSTTLDKYSHLTVNFQREAQKSFSDYLDLDVNDKSD